MTFGLRILRFFLKFLLYSFIASLAFVFIYRFAPVPFTPLMLERKFDSRKEFQSSKGIQKDWVPIEKIAKSMQRAVVVSEDAKFYEHKGFDFEAIEKAYQYNKTHKKKKGASTISQQTAKNVFLWSQRSWLRKGLEAYFTVLIETAWTKERILEVYLNVIEFGPEVYGVEAAARKYFNKSAQNLNASESALLTAVLPNPIRWKISSPGPYVLRRQQAILSRVYRTSIAQLQNESQNQSQNSSAASALKQLQDHGLKSESAADSGQLDLNDEDDALSIEPSDTDGLDQ